MTDELDPQAQEVRRLLADARHTEATPDHVVARLDRVLADLGAEPARVRPVTDLATRRRRVTRMLVAAAAVVALGVGVQQVIQPTAENDSASSGPAAADREELKDAPEEAPADSTASGSLPQPFNGEASGGRFNLSDRDFSVQAGKLQSLTITTLRSEAAYDLRLDASNSRGAATAAACRADTWGKGTFVAVTYRRAPAVLVFRRAMGDTQVADLFLCGSTEPTRSVTLPAP